jgi:hypothetical protein
MANSVRFCLKGALSVRAQRLGPSRLRTRSINSGVSGRLSKIGILPAEGDGHGGVERRPDRDAFAESLD